MNKYIEPIGSPISPERRKVHLLHSELRKMVRPLHTESQILTKDTSFPQEYLDADLASYCFESPNKQKKGSLLPVEPIAVRKIKQQLKYKRKKLIIQDCEQKQLQQESVSMIMTKNHGDSIQRRVKAFSSEKKSTIVHAFQVNSLPKRANIIEKKSSIEEERKCDLINSILQRYKLKEKIEIPDRSSSPSISSLKLNTRSYTEPKENYSPQQKKKNSPQKQKKEGENLKFYGWRGCPPGKMTKKFVSKRQKTQAHKAHISIRRTAPQMEEICPWETDELLI